MSNPLTCYDCGEPVVSPYMPVILNVDGSYARPGQSGDVHTQICLTCAHWRYWDPKMRAERDNG